MWTEVPQSSFDGAADSLSSLPQRATYKDFYKSSKMPIEFPVPDGYIIADSDFVKELKEDVRKNAFSKYENPVFNQVMNNPLCEVLFKESDPSVNIVIQGVPEIEIDADKMNNFANRMSNYHLENNSIRKINVLSKGLGSNKNMNYFYLNTEMFFMNGVKTKTQGFWISLNSAGYTININNNDAIQGIDYVESVH